jgi:hypothetical protein
VCVNGFVLEGKWCGLMMVGEWWLKEKEGLMGLGYGLFRVFSERGIKAYYFFLLFFSLSK